MLEALNVVESLAALKSLHAMYRRRFVLREKVGTKDPVRESHASRNKITGAEVEESPAAPVK
jgi:hypothetical protein